MLYKVDWTGFIHKIGAVALKLFQKIKLFFAADNHHLSKKIKNPKQWINQLLQESRTLLS